MVNIFKMLKHKPISYLCDCPKRVFLSASELAMLLPWHKVKHGKRNEYFVACAVCGTQVRRSRVAGHIICRVCRLLGWNQRDLEAEIKLGFDPKDEIIRRAYETEMLSTLSQ